MLAREAGSLGTDKHGIPKVGRGPRSESSWRLRGRGGVLRQTCSSAVRKT